MRLTLLTIGLLGASCGGAAAEDFSGFYAGVNAGYARQAGEREGPAPGVLPDGTGARAADSGLPPSARSASEAMRSRNRSSTPLR